MRRSSSERVRLRQGALTELGCLHPCFSPSRLCCKHQHASGWQHRTAGTALPAHCNNACTAQACHAAAPSHSTLRPVRLLAVTAATRPPPPAPLLPPCVSCPTLHPQVTDIRLITDRHTKRSKGLAYIEFSKQEEVFAALTLTGQVRGGNWLGCWLQQASGRPCCVLTEASADGQLGCVECCQAELHYEGFQAASLTHAPACSAAAAPAVCCCCCCSCCWVRL